MKLLYLHGFRSSPQSNKVRILAERVAQRNARGAGIDWHCPQLPASPTEAMALASGLIDTTGRCVVIGSSLGGFYAAQLANRFGLPCVLLNPGVRPARDLAPFVGEQHNWHDGQSFLFKPEYIDVLRAQEPHAPLLPETAKLAMAIIAKGDEVLDWREMCAAYPAATLRLLEGSDHAISEFVDHADAVLDFVMR
jgi:uncharacterized protein